MRHQILNFWNSEILVFRWKLLKKWLSELTHLKTKDRLACTTLKQPGMKKRKINVQYNEEMQPYSPKICILTERIGWNLFSGSFINKNLCKHLHNSQNFSAVLHLGLCPFGLETFRPKTFGPKKSLFFLRCCNSTLAKTSLE